MNYCFGWWMVVVWGFGYLGFGDLGFVYLGFGDLGMGIDCVWHDLLCCSLLLFMLIISKEFVEETGKKWKKTEVVEIILIVLG